MKKLALRVSEPIVWAVLLIGALGFAYDAWQRDPAAAANRAAAAIWRDRPETITSVVYEADDRSARLERRGSGSDSYLWGVAIRTRPEFREVSPDSIETLQVVDTARFVAGEPGQRLMQEVATPRVLRELGMVDDARKAEYGLAEPSARLTVNFGERVRELQLGALTFGSPGRYALDPASGQAYVVGGELVNLLADAGNRLPERRLHAFAPGDVGRVVARAGGSQRTMNRNAGSWEGESAWTSPDAPDRPDQTFANFMDRVRQLWVEGYVSEEDVAGLEPLLTIQYYGRRGNPLGTFEMFFRPGSFAEPEFLVRTELTRVPVRTYSALAEELADELSSIF